MTDDAAEGFPLPAAYNAEADSKLKYRYQEKPARTSFLSWHRARKHYVRQKQWAAATNTIMQGRDPADRLKYVGLPGIDLLDLRHLLREVCGPSDRRLQFIGFDLAAGSGGPDATELNISEVELKAEELVLNASQIRPDDFRVVASKGTSAWQALDKFAHFDVLNVDLTTHVLGESPEADLAYLAALREVFALQVSNPRPWVMLLTTRTDSESASEPTVARLLDSLMEGVEDCPDLKEVLAQKVSTDDLCNPFESSARDFTILTLTGFMQWVRGITMSGTVRTRPKLVSCFVYTSFATGGVPDMASLVIRFDQQPVTLDDEVMGVISPPEDDDPCPDYARYLDKVAGSRNIDELVREDDVLRAELIDQCAELMAGARYNVDDYRIWAEAQQS